MSIRCERFSADYLDDDGNLILFNSSTFHLPDAHPICTDARADRRTQAWAIGLVGVFGASVLMVDGRIRKRRDTEADGAGSPASGPSQMA